MSQMINTAINFLQKFGNKELAYAICIVIAIIWALPHPKIRKSIFLLIRAFFAWKLTILYVIMFSYISLIIILLKTFGIWNVAYLPVTILWVLCVAFGVVFEYMEANDQNFFKDTIKDNLKGLIVLEFIISLYVFDLWVYLILIPVLFFLLAINAIAETDEKFEIVKKLLDAIIGFIGIIITIYAIYMVVTNFKNYLTLENFTNFYLPILLTVIFLPFVYFVALYVGYDSLFRMLEIFVQDPAVLKYAKKRTIFTFKLNLWELNKWSEYTNASCRFKTKNEVDKAVLDFKNTTP